MPALLRQRENHLLGAAVVHRVVDADEVDGLVSHHRREVVVPGLARRGHADVADPPRLLHLLEDPHLHGDVSQVVHLDAVDGIGADVLEGLGDLRPGRGGVGGTLPRHVHLRRPEDPVGEPQVAGDGPGNLFRSPVTRGSIEDRAAILHEGTEHLAQGAEVLAPGDLGEGGRTSEPHGRHHLPGGGNGPADQLLARNSREPRASSRRGANGRAAPARAVRRSQSRRESMAVSRVEVLEGGGAGGGSPATRLRVPSMAFIPDLPRTIRDT
jgi:hypothetical protein